MRTAGRVERMMTVDQVLSKIESVLNAEIGSSGGVVTRCTNGNLSCVGYDGETHSMIVHVYIANGTSDTVRFDIYAELRKTAGGQAPSSLKASDLTIQSLCKITSSDREAEQFIDRTVRKAFRVLLVAESRLISEIRSMREVFDSEIIPVSEGWMATSVGGDVLRATLESDKCFTVELKRRFEYFNFDTMDMNLSAGEAAVMFEAVKKIALMRRMKED